MKFAFSTTCCTQWDMAAVITRAKEYGYDGVTLFVPNETVLVTASNVLLSDPTKIRGEFAAAGVAVSAIASQLLYSGKKHVDEQSARQAQRLIDLASAVGTTIVTVRDTPLKSNDAIIELGQWLLPLGDYAAERGVTIAVENAITFRRARQMWAVLDRLQHPSIACAWNPLSAAEAGESPTVSVPVLNHLIAYSTIQDGKLSQDKRCPLGQGDIAGDKLITRLRGIGYDGFVCADWFGFAFQPPEELLPASLATLKRWQKLGVAVKHKHHAVKH